MTHTDPPPDSRVERELAADLIDGRPGFTLVLRRHYQADLDAVWSACTTAARLRRWLGPVEGDLRLGGSFRIDGHVDGEILECEPPGRLLVQWNYASDSSTQVELRLSASDTNDRGTEETVLELRHTSAADTVNEIVRRIGPVGPIGIGGKWDVTLAALEKDVSDRKGAISGWRASPEAANFSAAANRAWAALSQAHWDLTEEATRKAETFAHNQFSSVDLP